MSLGVVVKGPDGVVLAADTRITLNAQRQGSTDRISVNFDNATKVLSFGRPHSSVGAVTYGQAVIGRRTAHSFVPELEPYLGNKRLTVFGYARKIGQFFKDRWAEANPSGSTPPGGGMHFIVGGYNLNAPYGQVFQLNVPNSPNPEEQNDGPSFGMSWGGQLEIASRIIHGYDPNLLRIIAKEFGATEEKLEEFRNNARGVEYTIPYDVLPLQDCIDLATFLIRTTITAQNLAVGIRGVGGSIEVATITRTDGLKWIQKKDLHGEA